MADITFNIPLPVLQVGEQFKYRYRTYPSGSFGGYLTTATQTITINGLSAGQYQLEVLLVKADASECPASLKVFTVTNPFSCYSFGASIIQSGTQYVLKIVYALPSPIVNPACKWKIVYAPQGYATTTLTYTSLPLTGEIFITLPANVATSLTIMGDLCNSNIQVCFEDSIPRAATACTPLVLTSYDLQFVGGVWGIRLFVLNSNPQTPIYQFNFTETSLLNPGATPDSGSFSWAGAGSAGGAALYSITNLNPQGIYLNNPQFPTEFLPNCIRYTGNIIDVCGNSHVFSVSGQWIPTNIGGQPGQGNLLRDAQGKVIPC